MVLASRPNIMNAFSAYFSGCMGAPDTQELESVLRL
jgi:hypothetical protein